MLVQGQGWTAFQPAGIPEHAEDSKRGPQPVLEAFDNVKIDELVKSLISDGFVKSSRSRLANPEE